MSDLQLQRFSGVTGSHRRMGAAERYPRRILTTPLGLGAGQGQLSYLLQLLDGAFLLVPDLLLLEGIGFQLPEPVLQASDAVLPPRGRRQQLPLLGLQHLHLLLQLRGFLLLLLRRQRGRRLESHDHGPLQGHP